MLTDKISRRRLLKLLGVGLGAAVLAACQPKIVYETKIVEKEVERVVKETVIVAGTPQVVEKVVEKVVQAAPKEKIQINFATPGGVGLERTMYTNFVYRFMDENPDIRVNVSFESWADYMTKLPTILAAGMTPDVCHAHWTIAMDYIYNGAFIDHTPFMDRDGIKRTDFIVELMDEFAHGGKQFMLPKDSALYGCYYNMTMFDKYGVPYPKLDWTIDDFVTTATLMTRDDAGRPANDPKFDKTKIKTFGCAYLDPTMAGDIPAGFTNAYGKHWFSEDLKTSNFDSDAVIQYWELTRKMRCVMNAMPTPAQAVGQGDLWRNAQLVAMKFDHQQNTFFAKQEAVQFKYDVTPLPSGPSGQFSPAACSAFGVTAKAPHLEEGWRLLRFLTSEVIQKWIGEQKRWSVNRPTIMDAIMPTDGIPAHYADVHVLPWSNNYKGVLKRIAMKAPVGMSKLKELYATNLDPVFTCKSDDVAGAARAMKIGADKVLAEPTW
jgi:multiple sugar transport system substrate-binding protein